MCPVAGHLRIASQWCRPDTWPCGFGFTLESFRTLNQTARDYVDMTEEDGDQTVVEEEIHSLIPGPELAVDIAIAIVIVVLGWYISKLVVRLTGRTVAQKIERPSVTRTVLRAIRISVIGLAALVAANVLGLGGFEILLSVTVISAVVGVVLAPLIGSLINGIFILADRPYEIGDMIEVTDEGHRGFVEDITIRYTKIFTLENTFIVIPNSEIHQRDVINYSAEDERTRVNVRFEITYESDLERAITIAQRAARNVDGVIAGGPDIRIGSARYAASPVCDVLEYADDGVLLQLRFWASHPYKLTVVQSAVNRVVREQFASEGIEFAYPHTHHVFDETSGTARVATMSATRDDERHSAPLGTGEATIGDGGAGGAEAGPGSDRSGTGAASETGESPDTREEGRATGESVERERGADVAEGGDDENGAE